MNIGKQKGKKTNPDKKILLPQGLEFCSTLELQEKKGEKRARGGDVDRLKSVRRTWVPCTAEPVRGRGAK
jgi:hypothetical protein